MKEPPILVSSSTVIPSQYRRRSWVVWGLVLVSIAVPSLFLYGIMSCFGLGSDLAAVREAVKGPSAPALYRLAEFRLGWIPLTLARQGGLWLDLGSQARRALDSVRSVEVGVYACNDANGQPGCAQLMAAGDGVLQPLGWVRVVGLVHEGDVVGVYARDHPGDPEDIRFCALVRHEGRLALASIRCRAGPLLAVLETIVRPERPPRS